MIPVSSFSSLAKAFLNSRQKVGNGKLSYLMYWYHCYCEMYNLMGRGREEREDIHIPRPNLSRFCDRFTISGRDTKAIDNVVVEWKYVGWYNYSSGKQREVKRFLPPAIQFFEEVRSSGFEIPEDILRKFYHSTLDCETIHLMGMGVGGSRRFYHSTSSSPFRLYHPLQQTKKEDQPQVFKGCTNIDITSCFLSLYWYDMGGKDLNGPEYYYLLNPNLKDDLHKKIAESFEGDVKSFRNNLTQTNKNGHITMTGVKWYDDLHHFVVGHARQWGREVLGWDYDECTPHKLFTFLELRLINRLIGCGTLVLRMHDGIIFKDVDIQALKERATPYLVKVEKW
jgi:hypothetical protein